MLGIQTQQPNRAPDLPTPNRLQLTFTGDAILVLGAFAWVFWDRFIRSKVISKLDGVFAPIEEERVLNNILAQIGVITHASRVVLGAFHNGQISSGGYHLTKLSTINSYTAPGRLPMTVPIRDLPVGRIMFELEELLSPEGDCWSVVQYRDDLPAPCRDHLKRNNIHRMFNRIIKVGNLPIGILSLQYDESERRDPPIREEPYIKLLEELYEQIAHIMRRRIIHPGPLRLLWMRIRGNSQTSPTK
ncbi:MAG: hypothetical protein ACO3PY_06170 [Pontimonas sp.]